MRCPVCGDRVDKIHRHPFERFISIFYSVHRYRCASPECGWEGTLHRDGSVHDGNEGKPSFAVRLVWFALGAGALYAGQQATEYYVDRFRPTIDSIPMFALYEDTPSQTVAKGEDDPGEALPLDDARAIENRSSLRIRKGCAWGVPGSNPYKGSVRDALIGTKIPGDVIDERLVNLAQEHAFDMAQSQRLSHDGFSARFNRANSELCVENVGWNFRHAESQVDGWRGSPGHNRNLLDAEVKRVGIAVSQGYVEFFACA